MLIVNSEFERSGRKRYWLNFRLYPKISVKGLSTTRKIPVWILGVPTEIRSEPLSRIIIIIIIAL
jgi:hypothetical protein